MRAFLCTFLVTIAKREWNRVEFDDGYSLVFVETAILFLILHFLLMHFLLASFFFRCSPVSFLHWQNENHSNPFFSQQDLYFGRDLLPFAI